MSCPNNSSAMAGTFSSAITSSRSARWDSAVGPPVSAVQRHKKARNDRMFLVFSLFFNWLSFLFNGFSIVCHGSSWSFSCSMLVLSFSCFFKVFFHGCSMIFHGVFQWFFMVRFMFIFLMFFGCCFKAFSMAFHNGCSWSFFMVSNGFQFIYLGLTVGFRITAMYSNYLFATAGPLNLV